jgi:protein-S-isoprenylcysteine O-methyltransferase Ste14
MVLLLKIVVFTLVAPGTVTVLVPALVLQGGLDPTAVRGFRGAAGVVLMLGGALLYGWCAWAFARVGRGTPAPVDPPRVLVTGGLYAWTRNPMYLGVLSVLLGEAVAFGSSRLLAYAAVVFLAFHLFTVLYEEPAHRRRFGPAFEEYCRRVPRWLPRLQGGR